MVRIATPTRLEVGFSARSAGELHVDKDFELIAGVTGQAVERLTVT